MASVTLPNFPEVVAYNPASDVFFLELVLAERGITYSQQREINMQFRLLGGVVFEFAYPVEGSDRWTYVVRHKVPGKQIGERWEESLVCQAPIMDPNRLQEAFLQVRLTEGPHAHTIV